MKGILYKYINIVMQKGINVTYFNITIRICIVFLVGYKSNACAIQSPYNTSINNIHLHPLGLARNILKKTYEFNYLCEIREQEVQGLKLYRPLYFLKSDYDYDKKLRGKLLMSDDECIDILEKAICLYEKTLHAHDSCWVPIESNIPEQQNRHVKPAHAYAQAKVLSATTRIIVMGDYHGSAHSLARNILRMQYQDLVQASLINSEGLLDPSVQVVILGDLADRGHYGIETWALALALKLSNPNQVTILQGNHEGGELHNFYGLVAEVQSKYGKKATYINSLFPKLFSLLPQVLFIGVKNDKNDHVSYLYFCHGGMALQPKNYKILTINDLFSREEEEAEDIIEDSEFNVSVYFQPLLKHSAENPYTDFFGQYCVNESLSGFLWDGFLSTTSIENNAFRQGSRGTDWLIHGSAVMDHLKFLSVEDIYSIDGVIRGHDHLDYGVNILANFAQRSKNNDSLYWEPLTQPKKIVYNSTLHVFPIFTITSISEALGIDAFAFLTFDEDDHNWIITPCIKNSYVPDHKACWLNEICFESMANIVFNSKDVQPVGDHQ